MVLVTKAQMYNYSFDYENINIYIIIKGIIALIYRTQSQEFVVHTVN